MGTAAIQGGLWSGNPRDWAELQEPQFSPLYQAVLDSVGMAVWCLPKDCQAAALLKAMGSLLPPPPPGTPGPFALSEAGVMEAMLSKAGLKPGRAVDVDTPFDFKDDETGYRAMAASGNGIRAARVAGPDKLRAALLAALAPFKTASGSCHLDNKFRFVVARL
jgi:hypothetical protein